MVGHTPSTVARRSFPLPTPLAWSLASKRCFRLDGGGAQAGTELP